MAKNYSIAIDPALRNPRTCDGSSSAIARAGYDPDREVMTITFNSGKSYAYQGISPQTFGRYCAADSKGGFFSRNIRDKYAFRRLG